jgi:hypothetical protein
MTQILNKLSEEMNKDVTYEPKENDRWFGEWVHFTPDDHDECVQFLRSWKKFLLRKIHIAHPDAKIETETWVERPNMKHSSLASVEPDIEVPATLALKICISGIGGDN